VLYRPKTDGLVVRADEQPDSLRLRAHAPWIKVNLPAIELRQANPKWWFQRVAGMAKITVWLDGRHELLLEPRHPRVPEKFLFGKRERDRIVARVTIDEA